MLHTKLHYTPKSFTPVHEIVYPTNQLRRLLVVTEDESALVAMERHFSALGWQVDCAFELEEAEALLACRSYSAVVTNLNLSGNYGGAGLRIVSQVRARCPRTSVFLWTAARTPELEAAAQKRGGVDGFLAKPQTLADMATRWASYRSSNMPKTCLLDRILQPGGVSVLFQPIVDAGTDNWTIHSVECLARGPKATNIESAPLLFEYARRKQAEHQIDRACIAQALRYARALPSGMRFSVNVHASTLGRERDFVIYLQELAFQYNLDLARITIEIVENLPFWDETGFLRNLSALRALGVKIALDDVGMGYSNYRMMLDARPDYFKIDRYLVEGSHADYQRQIILESIVNLADKLNATVIAEGITNYADLALVRSFGLNLMQGHLFAKAMTAADLLNNPLHPIPNTWHYGPVLQPQIALAV